MSNLNNALELIASQEKTFLRRAAGHNEVNFAKEAGFAKQALQSNDFLLLMAQNNPESLKNAITNVAAIGISLNPAEKHAYLVPMDKRVNLQVSYLGLVNLATKSGAVEWVKAELVKERDSFEMNGTGKAPTHNYDPFADRGAIRGAYCVAKLPVGDYLVEIMSLEEINKIKSISKSASKPASPWSRFPEEMMKKTVIKRASKMWPAAKNNRLLEAIHVSNETEGINFEEQKQQDEKRRNEINEAAKVDYLKVSDLVLDIVKECNIKGGDLDLKGKLSLMKDVCKCELELKELSRKSVVELEEILIELKGIE